VVFRSLHHVAVVVQDLDAAVADYQVLLGRTPNGSGADGGAAHAWFQLSNMALDLIAPAGAGYTGDRVRAHLDRHGEGVWSAAFTTPDIQKSIRRLARCGVGASEAQPIRSTHVQSAERRCWTTSLLDPADTHGPLLFLVEQTPEAAPWPPSDFRGDHATTVVGLDHVVITTSHPERAAALYGARLDLEMALDRTNLDWGSRLLFFRCGDVIVEIVHDLRAASLSGADRIWGLSWRAANIEAMHARLVDAAVNVSEIRTGRKPGTRVFTVRDHTRHVPTLVISREIGDRG
jgi:catechol 2,3-dioxygenase-like lactoylglutathione lyase family enzyme